MKTVLITGSKGSGKSSLLNRIFMELQKPLTGVRSIRNFENNYKNGYDLAIFNGGKLINQKPLLREKDGIKIFKDFKRESRFLENLLKNNKSDAIFVDEVGRFEREDKNYLKSIEKLLESEIFAVISLKKENLSFNKMLIEKSENDQEIGFIDLDEDKKSKRKDLISKIKGEFLNQKIIYYDDEIKDIQDNTEKLKIENIYDLDFESSKKYFDNQKINFYYSKDILKLKRAADLGFVAIKDFNEENYF